MSESVCWRMRNMCRAVFCATVLPTQGQATPSRASGGENLTSSHVSSLPLNERHFSNLLLLAAGTMTDTNGSANFTQQFAVNGQRATASVLRFYLP